MMIGFFMYFDFGEAALRKSSFLEAIAMI